MAIGSALLLGIKLPINFNSPYKSKNIREFWDRWHISLSTWLRDYVYIPLGGSRHGNVKTYINIIITFIISGAWHGSTFNFIL
ncbi:MBOAT family protein, partial [Salmonella enterica]|nr:MBOAT family protein [Salmonella enterica]